VLVVLNAIPGFLFALLLVVLFAGGTYAKWFPLRGLVSDNWAELGWFAKITDYLWHMVLPITASVVGSFAVMTMLTKNSFLEEIRKQYVLTARAKGLSERRVVLGHALRAALIPVITVIGLDFGSYLTGSILTETIFSWPGVGRYVLTAIEKRDLPAVQGSILMLSVVFVLVNLLTDLLYTKADPRVARE